MKCSEWVIEYVILFICVYMKLQIILCYRCVYDMIFITLFLKLNHITSWSSLCPVTYPGFAPVSLGYSRLQGMWLIRTTEKGEEISQSGPIQIMKQEGQTALLRSTRSAETLKMKAVCSLKHHYQSASAQCQNYNKTWTFPTENLKTYNLCSIYNLIVLSLVNIK